MYKIRSLFKFDNSILKSGDTILLFTDRLPELTNSDNKAFDYPEVKKYFNEIARLDSNMIIEKFIRKFDEWKRDTTQNDDISFVGIKIK